MASNAGFGGYGDADTPYYYFFRSRGEEEGGRGGDRKIIKERGNLSLYIASAGVSKGR